MKRGTAAELAFTAQSLTDTGYAPMVVDRLARLASRTVGADAASILVRDRRDPRAVIVVSAAGEVDLDVVGRRVSADEGVVARVMAEGEALPFSSAGEVAGELGAALPPALRAGGCAPVEWEGIVQGALVVASTGARGRFGRIEFSVLSAVADVAGAALEHAERREHGIETVRARVESLAAALELRDRVTGHHVAEVVRLARAVGEKLGLSKPALVELEFAARLHDVGKIAVPDPILRKPDPLTDTEWSMMRRHPEWGSGMLAHIPGLEAVALVVRFHHERWDGSGYPDGLEGERIPLASRVIAVCDAYNAMTADRTYSLGRSREEALAELRACAGEQFDPRVVEAFIESCPEPTPAPRRRRWSRG